MKKNDKVLQRLKPNRPMMTISMRVPEDVVDDLKSIAPALGFSGYQPLIRAYVGQGLRKDLSRLRNPSADALADGLRRRGVDDKVIQDALDELQHAAS